MKKLSFFGLILSLCLTFSLNAQNTFPSSGNVGIGTTSPAANLQIDGTSSSSGQILRMRAGSSTKLLLMGNGGMTLGEFNTAPPANGLRLKGKAYLRDQVGIGISPTLHDVGLEIYNDNFVIGGSQIRYLFSTDYWNSSSNNSLSITPGDGTNWDWNNSFKIMEQGEIVKNVDHNNEAIIVHNETDGEDVFRVYGNGQVYANRLKILEYGAFPDYVFDKDYDLMSLENVESFIKANKHLPNVPSANDIDKNGGMDLGELTRLQMEKIEELYLHIIQQQKEIQELKQTVTNK